MTTDELLWNAAFEADNRNEEYAYSYEEERSIERYYHEKELFDRLSDLLKPAV